MNDNSNLSILSDNVDKSQVPPIEQKRMVAFINDFITSTVTFLNDFMTKCENKFVEFEQKMQRIESSLLIVEAKMASIPDVEPKSPSNQKTDDKTENEPIEKEPQATTSSAPTQDTPPTSQATETVEEKPETQVESSQDDENDKSSGVKACDDTRYRKFFKMLQFGVPAPAVKLKMANEGFDPNVLDDPKRILEDGVAFVPTEE